jgi:hypothetical protein
MSKVLGKYKQRCRCSSLQSLCCSCITITELQGSFRRKCINVKLLNVYKNCVIIYVIESDIYVCQLQRRNMMQLFKYYYGMNKQK